MRSVHLSARAKILLLVAVLVLVVQFVALSVVGDVALAATVGAYTLALLALAAAVPALAGAQPFAPHPELEVHLELDGPAVFSVQIGPRWIDVEAIVTEQLERSWSTAPPPPRPPSSTLRRGPVADALLDQRLTQARISNAGLISGGVRLDREARERLGKRVDRYEQELRGWLAGLEEAVWERSSALHVRLVVQNASSRAPARDLADDLEFPAALTLDDRLAPCKRPPRRPSYEAGRSSAYRSVLADLELPRVARLHIINSAELRETPGGDGRRWSASLPAVLHAGASETSRWLKLSVDGPGCHQLVATVRALNLDPPAVTTRVLEIPAHRAPERRLATLEELCRFLQIEHDGDGDDA